ncbi:uncharacterized protein LOC110861154 [Folsomia candida]|uniref:uncharacterized protein LOC110861154 n=1 Tax=Folsomia candida TaxID=158441 RepID=UPI000B9077E1|nr:uncharacterized protein LOC110861154 [Folsomia candida]
MPEPLSAVEELLKPAYLDDDNFVTEVSALEKDMLGTSHTDSDNRIDGAKNTECDEDHFEPEPRPSTIRRRQNRANIDPVLAEKFREAEKLRGTYRRNQKKSTPPSTYQSGVSSEVDESIVSEQNCGSMPILCEECGSINFKDEWPKGNSFTYCCKKGRIKEPQVQMCQLIQDLMTGKHQHSKNFMENVRSFNSALAFASMGANVYSAKGRGPYTFRIHGQIYHLTGNLHPDEGDSPKYSQLYIFDPNEASNQRINTSENSGCNIDLMKILSEWMSQNNKFTEAYRMLFEVEQESETEAMKMGIAPPEVSMTIIQDRSMDLRVYNAPRSNEVAIVFKNSDGEPPLERDLRIHLRSDSTSNIRKTKTLYFLDPNIDALTYPLLFPFSDQAWNMKLRLTDGKQLTQMRWCGYQFAIRKRFNAFLSAGRLTQQYIVDSYVKMEANRLNYIKTNQKKLRVEHYKGLMDHLNSEADLAGVQPGKAIILPSSFPGSPRNMQQNYQDAMAMVRKYGKPDLFITMTCNPKWIEIVENLEPGQCSENRPDLVARVFNIKLKELLDDLQEKHIFGKVVGVVHVIEFQKRGLPHAHILLILEPSSKPSNTEIIDKIVCAEVPNAFDNPRLYQYVKSHMIHGPCGSKNMLSPCMDKSKCTKEFPKEFQEVTVANLNGYPRYRRRDNGISTTVGRHEVNNLWVVPYNPYLLLKYNCHINVEVCASIKSVKYLYKYVYKGYDCARIVVKEGNVQHNEVESFLESRWVGAAEGAWRIFGFNMHKQSHTIVRLQVHLEDFQSIVFDPEKLADEILEVGARRTTLSAWFDLNTIDESARELLYTEIPGHYRFVKGKWIKRIQAGNNVIGRRYYLRLLLLHVRGATSYDDIRTVDGTLCPNFQDTAKKYGLLNDDSVWLLTLEEAAVASMPKQMRELFALICVFGLPNDVNTLWMNFKQAKCEDFAHRNNHENCIIHCENLALTEVESVLWLHGKRCIEVGLPAPIWVPVDLIYDFDVSAEASRGMELFCSLNDKQHESFSVIWDAISDAALTSKCFFLDGPGGTGKTFVYETLIASLRGEGTVASTGIAANLLPNGRTYHSQYKLPVPLVETSVSDIRLTSQDAQNLREASLLIWDESTMAPSHALNAVDRLLRELMNNETPFGGKVLLLGGDFRQCLPVVVHGTKAGIIEVCLKSSRQWKEFRFLHLTENVRSVDPEYSEWILSIGDGTLTNDDNLPDDIVEIPQDLISSGNIVEEIYGKSLLATTIHQFTNRTILSPKNEHVDGINAKVLEVLNSIEDKCDQDANNYPIEFLNGLNPSGMPPHSLQLKVGAIIMLLRNLNTKRGLCKGTPLIVKELKPNLIIAEVISGTANGRFVFIPRIDLAPITPDLPFILHRRQFPVKLAFAMTINKSQGQTFDKVGLHLPEPVFSHGQLCCVVKGTPVV